MIGYGVDSDGIPNSSPGVMPASVVMVARYLRNLRRGEVDQHHANGRNVLLIHEYAPNDPLRGSAWGDQDAHTAIAQARALGAPAGCAMALTCDTDAPPSVWPAVEAYWRAALPIIHAAGYLAAFYAGEDLLDHLLALGLIDLAWGVGATSWDHQHRSSRVAWRQLPPPQVKFGVTCDLNEVYTLTGLWPPTGAPSAPPAPAAPIVQPAPVPQEWTMHAVKKNDADPIYTVGTDGFGVYVKTNLGTPEMVVLLEQTGQIDGVITLTDPKLKATLDALPTVDPGNPTAQAGIFTEVAGVVTAVKPQ